MTRRRALPISAIVLFVAAACNRAASGPGVARHDAAPAGQPVSVAHWVDFQAGRSVEDTQKTADAVYHQGAPPPSLPSSE